MKTRVILMAEQWWEIIRQEKITAETQLHIMEHIKDRHYSTLVPIDFEEEVVDSLGLAKTRGRTTLQSVADRPKSTL